MTIKDDVHLPKFFRHSTNVFITLRGSQWVLLFLALQLTSSQKLPKIASLKAKTCKLCLVPNKIGEFIYLVRLLVKDFLFFRDVITNRDVLIFRDHLEKKLHRRHALLPVLWLHGGRDLRVVVEDCGADGKLDFDGHASTKVVLIGDVEKLVQEFDLLLTIGALLA